MIEDQPAHGTAFQYIGDLVGYKADPNFNTQRGDVPGGQWVSDSFTYRAYDGFAYSSPATMRFWVAPINDAPTFTRGGNVTVFENSGQYSGGWASSVSPGPSEAYQTVHFELVGPVSVEGHGAGPLFVDLPAIDSDGNLTFKIRPDNYGVAHVTVHAKDDGGLENYAVWPATPQADDTSGDVTFDIVVQQGAVAAVDDNVQLPEDPETYPWPSPGLPNPWPVDVLANDTVPPGSTITVVTQGSLGSVSIKPDGLSVLYAPQVNANGSDAFSYTVDDHAGSIDTATVHLTINPTNDAPVAVHDSVSIAQGADATSVDVLTNDSDVDGDTLIVSGASGALKGTIVIAADAKGVTYQPNPGARGADRFTYTITDGFLIGPGLFASSTATVDVTITATNTDPIAAPDSVTVSRNASATSVDVLANDSDVDSDALTITATTDGAKGTVAITGDGNGLTFQPDVDAAGSDSFTYTIDDGNSGSATATVSVTITDSNTDPVATADSPTIAEDAGATAVSVLANDTDTESDALTIARVTDGTHGAVVITGGGAGLTYQSDPDYNGPDSFTYTISDGHGGSATGTVTVTITPVNDDPVAALDSLQIDEDAGTTTLDVLANDTDIDGDSLPDDLRQDQWIARPGRHHRRRHRPDLQAEPQLQRLRQLHLHDLRRPRRVRDRDRDRDDHPGQRRPERPQRRRAHRAGERRRHRPRRHGQRPGRRWRHPDDHEQDEWLARHRRDHRRRDGPHLRPRPALRRDGRLHVHGHRRPWRLRQRDRPVDGRQGHDPTDRDRAVPALPDPDRRSTTTGARIGWSGSDAGTGIAKYQLQVSVNGGTFSTILLPSATTTSTNRTLTDGRSYRYRVRATDRQGNVSPYAYGPTFKVARFQDSSATVTYAGAWSHVASASALTGRVSYSSSTSARAFITRGVRDFAWVATKTPTSGSAQVWIDGVLATTVSLRSTSTTYRRLVFQRHFSGLATHTIEVRPIGGGRIYLDVFLAYR